MNFDLTILGSGSALPTSRRYCTAHALSVHERFFLIDCGEGTQIQLRKSGVKLSRLNHIFISHLHGDHVFGLFGLLSTFNLLGRKSDLQLFGPADLQKIINFYIEQFTEGMQYKIIFNPITTRNYNLIFTDNHVDVYSFPLKHRVPTWGFYFLEKEKELKLKKDTVDKYQLSIKNIIHIKKGNDFVSLNGEIIPNADLTIPPSKARSYAFCSDTAYYERIIKWVEGVDILYHEATFASAERKIAKQTSHSTAQQAATIAKKAGVKKLIIGHYSNRYKDLEVLLREARDIFPETYLAEDLEIHSVNN
jgi:ribonuclease Z